MLCQSLGDCEGARSLSLLNLTTLRCRLSSFSGHCGKKYQNPSYSSSNQCFERKDLTMVSRRRDDDVPD